jgi:predicted  nucleic acid-binding Zn-ribbon protein
MSQPEISHRCESCGVSIREQAMFCPECGQALVQPAADSETPDKNETPAPAGADQEAVASRATLLEAANAATDIATAADKPSAATAAETASVATEKPPATQAEPVPGQNETVALPQNVSAPASPVSRHRTYEKAREGLHRASTATRGALADNVKRVDKSVDKIRHVSSAVFEEASYDPSLRFVLVALGLFVAFLILLLLSKVMG